MALEPLPLRGSPCFSTSRYRRPLERGSPDTDENNTIHPLGDLPETEGTASFLCFLNAPADKKSSRVPAYQNIKIIDGFCDYFFKPLPWRGHRGLGYRLKPSLRRKVGWLEDCRESLHYSRPLSRDSKLCFFLRAEALGYAACYQRDARK